MKSLAIRVLAAALLCFAFSPLVLAQGPPLPGPLGYSPSGATGWVMIYLRGQDGKPIPMSQIPQISISSAETNTAIPQFPRREGNGWAYSGLATGVTYEIDVKVDGYQPAHQTVDVPSMDYGSANAFFILRPSSEQPQPKPAGQYVLAPRVQKEVQKGLGDLRSSKISSARKHFQQAFEMAPANPYVNYLLGVTYLMSKQLPEAKPYLEESVSLDPNQVPSLLALGTLRFDQKDYSGAIDVLNKAVALEPSSWKAHWLLATSYLDQRDYQSALTHGEKALASGQAAAEPVRLVLAEASAAMGDRQGALTMLNRFLLDHPNDVYALRLLASLLNDAAAKPRGDQPHALEAATVPAQPQPVTPPPTAAVDVPPRDTWAPPDIDSERPLISSTECSLPRVLKAAGKSATLLVDELQEFTSTEEYQTVEIKQDQNLEKPISRTFSYMAFIEHPRPRMIHVDEFREQGPARAEMPGELADIGAPALALAFHPFLQSDFSWSCEGLGKWNDKPAWVVRFEQLPDRPDQLLSFQTPGSAYPLPLKGRAWISERGGHVVRIEADLSKPLAAIRLKRERFVIDYLPVNFKTHNVTLWLPESVDIYYQYRGHYLHHYHHFSNFQLFWTGASQKDDLRKAAGSRNP